MHLWTQGNYNFAYPSSITQKGNRVDCLEYSPPAKHQMLQTQHFLLNWSREFLVFELDVASTHYSHTSNPLLCFLFALHEVDTAHTQHHTAKFPLHRCLSFGQSPLHWRLSPANCHSTANTPISSFTNQDHKIRSVHEMPTSRIRTGQMTGKLLRSFSSCLQKLDENNRDIQTSSEWELYP